MLRCPDYMGELRVTFTEWLQQPSTRVTNDSAGRLIYDMRADASMPSNLPGPGNEVPEGEKPFTESDFSAQTIERHKQAGYLIAKRVRGAKLVAV